MSIKSVIFDHMPLTAGIKLDKIVIFLLAALAILGLLQPAQLPASLSFMFSALAGIAPFFLLAVGLAGWIKASGADRVVARVFSGHPLKAVAIAAVFGALSPFCSCGVIPLIASLLAAGVPLAPVMAFWIASPIMDPEMFILTSAGISLDFALAKAGFAIALGLFAGVTVLLMQRFGRLGSVLKPVVACSSCSTSSCSPEAEEVQWRFWTSPRRIEVFKTEFIQTGAFLGKWLALAFFIESLMVAYVDPAWIQQYIGGDAWYVVPLAAVIGMPSYLNGYAAIPLVGGLLDMGMAPGAAMAFMLAGAVSSIPAAIAVFALVKKPVFLLYLSIGLSGSIIAGLVFQGALI